MEKFQVLGRAFLPCVFHLNKNVEIPHPGYLYLDRVHNEVYLFSYSLEGVFPYGMEEFLKNTGYSSWLLAFGVYDSESDSIDFHNVPGCKGFAPIRQLDIVDSPIRRYRVAFDEMGMLLGKDAILDSFEKPKKEEPKTSKPSSTKKKTASTPEKEDAFAELIKMIKDLDEKVDLFMSE